MTAASPGRRLRQAWAAGTIAVPGVFCPLVARMAERMGFPAVYLSGAALSATLGVPDIGLVTATEFADAARAIVAASTLPLLCDADTGFGEALNAERTVRLFESAGAAGIHLEDQELPKRCGHLSGKSLVPMEVMVAKLRAADDDDLFEGPRSKPGGAETHVADDVTPFGRTDLDEVPILLPEPFDRQFRGVLEDCALQFVEG